MKRWRRAKAVVAETAVLTQKLDAVMSQLLAFTALAVWCCQQNQPEIGLALWLKAEQAELVRQSVWFRAMGERFVQPGTIGLAPKEMDDFEQLLMEIRPLLQ